MSAAVCTRPTPSLSGHNATLPVRRGSCHRLGEPRGGTAQKKQKKQKKQGRSRQRGGGASRGG
eukprot:708708-Prorocentrum_minimum.AAC.2